MADEVVVEVVSISCFVTNKLLSLAFVLYKNFFAQNGDIDENLPETQENVPKIDDLTAKIRN